MNIDDIPGYAEARRREASIRAEAFLAVPRVLCGVSVVPLTLYRLGILTAARNPFVCGGESSLETVAMFLWVASPSFQVGGCEARAGFLARLRETQAFADLAECSAEIEEFVEEMLMDAPAGGGKSGPAITSNEAVYCDIFGDAYGWDDERTMHKPLPQLWQLLRRITLRHDPKALFINPSDKIRGEWLRAQSAETTSIIQQTAE